MDAQTYFDQIILLDSGTHGDQTMKTSSQVQTLAIRKKKSTKSKPMTPGMVTPPTIAPVTPPETTNSTECEQDGEYSSSSTHEFLDSDDDYV